MMARSRACRLPKIMGVGFTLEPAANRGEPTLPRTVRLIDLSPGAHVVIGCGPG